MHILKNEFIFLLKVQTGAVLDMSCLQNKPGQKWGRICDTFDFQKSFFIKNWCPYFRYSQNLFSSDQKSSQETRQSQK